jgi:hypothetical protein
MKLNTVLNEISAEMVGNKIPAHKIFDANGNLVKLKAGSEWAKVLGEIVTAIKSVGMEKEFSSDSDPLDFTVDKNGKFVLVTSDTGKKYKYNINTKKFTHA